MNTPRLLVLLSLLWAGYALVMVSIFTYVTFD